MATRRTAKSAPVIPALMTIREACERLGCSRWTIYRAVELGRLTFVYVASAPRLLRTEVEAIATGAQTPTGTDG